MSARDICETGDTETKVHEEVTKQERMQDSHVSGSDAEHIRFNSHHSFFCFVRVTKSQDEPLGRGIFFLYERL